MSYPHVKLISISPSTLKIKLSYFKETWSVLPSPALHTEHWGSNKMEFLFFLYVICYFTCHASFVDALLSSELPFLLFFAWLPVLSEELSLGSLLCTLPPPRWHHDLFWSLCSQNRLCAVYLITFCFMPEWSICVCLPYSTSLERSGTVFPLFFF